MQPTFHRVSDQAILTPEDMPFSAGAVLNPGAVEQDGEVVLLLRVEDTTGGSSIHVARSRNGVDGWSIESEPMLRYGQPDRPYETWGCEDPRVTFIPDDGCYYITYTAASAYGAAVAIARSDDLVSARRLGLALSPSNKDGVLLPGKFEGRYAMLHRPDVGDLEHIWSAYSPDMLHWGEPRCVLQESGGTAWDGYKVGAGPPPILTEHGWLMLYHGVKAYGGRMIYRVGVALLDRDQPHQLLRRGPSWVFQARAQFELAGLVPSVIFPTGLLLRGDELWMYYGAADTAVGLAKAKLDDVLAKLDHP